MKAIGTEEITVFIDVETTGLTPADNHLLEVAIVLAKGRSFTEIAAKSFTCLPEGLSALGARASANAYVLDMHKKSGLWDDLVAQEKSGQVLRYSQDPAANTLDHALAAFLNEWDLDSGMLFGGNSQNLDRAFLEAFAPEFYSRLSYRSLDETSVQYFGSSFGLISEIHSPVKSSSSHRGISDIRECLEGLRFQRSVIIRAAMGGPYSAAFDVSGDEAGLVVLFGSEDNVELAASAVRMSAALDYLGADLVFTDSASSAKIIGRDREFTADDMSAISATSMMFSDPASVQQ